MNIASRHSFCFAFSQLTSLPLCLILDSTSVVDPLPNNLNLVTLLILAIYLSCCGLFGVVHWRQGINPFGFKGIKSLIYNAGEGQIHTGLMMQALIQLAQRLQILILNGVEIESFN